MQNIVKFFSLHFKLKWNMTRTYLRVIHSLTGVIVTELSNSGEGVVWVFKTSLGQVITIKLKSSF